MKFNLIFTVLQFNNLSENSGFLVTSSKFEKLSGSLSLLYYDLFLRLSSNLTLHFFKLRFYIIYILCLKITTSA